MKTYNLTNRKSAEAKKELERIIETHEKYKNSYFMYPASSARQRRSNEKNFYLNNPSVCFKKGQDVITCQMDYQETCGNVYYSLTVKVNDKIKDIRSIKKLL